jgi:hypothetical protein
MRYLLRRQGSTLLAWAFTGLLVLGMGAATAHAEEEGDDYQRFPCTLCGCADFFSHLAICTLFQGGMGCYTHILLPCHDYTYGEG